jgi:hypothetical protein
MEFNREVFSVPMKIKLCRNCSIAGQYNLHLSGAKKVRSMIAQFEGLQNGFQGVPGLSTSGGAHLSHSVTLRTHHGAMTVYSSQKITLPVYQLEI